MVALKAESMAQRDSDDTEKANVARQKLKSLFLSLDLSSKQSIQSIKEAIRDLQDPIVDHILKRFKTFTFQDAQTLQESIKSFVRNNSSDAAGSINFWAVIDYIRSVRDWLVRRLLAYVCRISINAPVLNNGLVIVNVPGTHVSN